MKNILLYAPPLNENGVYVHDVHDGELLYLGAFLFNYGYTIKIIDCYADPMPLSKVSESISTFKPTIVIVHLWKNAFLKNNRLHQILKELSILKNQLKIESIIAIGSIAVSLRAEILNYQGIVSAIVSENGIFASNKVSIDLKIIQDYYKSFTALSRKFIQSSGIKFLSTDVVSLYSSRGCKKGCSFCSYNKDSSKWKSREISALASDLTLINKMFDVKNFGLFDSNFGNNIENNLERSQEMLDVIGHLKVNIALNVSFDGLNKEVLDNFKRSGVNVILVGLESLNQDTLRTIYNKDQDIIHAKKMIAYSERINVTPIVSYIFFHPYLSMSDIKSEIEKVESFGRYRIVQFIARSITQVMPGTKLEKMLEKDNLLIKNKDFYRDFAFLNNDVNDFYLKLRKYYDSRIKMYNLNPLLLSKLKYLEWEYIKKLIY